MIDKVHANVSVKDISKVDGRQRVKQFTHDKKDCSNYKFKHGKKD